MSVIAGLSWPTLAGAWAVILFSGILRGFSGFGFALAASPLLALLIPPREAVPVVLMLQLGSSLIGVRQSLGRWDREASVTIAAAAIATTPLGVLLLHLVNADIARMGMALATLSAVLVLAGGPVKFDLTRRRSAVPFGFAAGVLGGASAIPGPPVIAYFLARDTPAPVARASMNLIFMATSLTALGASLVAGAISRSELLIAALCAPVMIVGTAAGSWAFERADARLYRSAGLAMLSLIALVALARAIL